MRDRTQEALPIGHVEPPHLDILRMHRRRASVETLDRAAIELHQDVVHVLGVQVDEWRLGVQCFPVGERTALENGFRGEGNIATARFRQRSRVRRNVGGGLLRRRIVHFLARARDRVSRAGMSAWRHCRDVGGDQQNEPGRCGTRA
jgi:hypothetical protein